MACEDAGTKCIVRLSGRITIDSSPGLRKLLLGRLQSPDCQTLTLDLGDVPYVDTSGLATLVEALKAAHASSKKLALSGLRERPRYLLDATRLLRLFDSVPTGREL